MRKTTLIIGFIIAFNFCKGQKIIYGVNVDKAYPTIELEKEFTLKIQAVFYSVKIINKGQEFVFSTIEKGFGPFKKPERYYYKGLTDIKKVFGNPINIYTDTSFTKPTSDFYIWKVKNKDNYFFIYYSLSRLGLSLNIEKIFNEENINKKIISDIYSEQNYIGKSYFIKAKELNIAELDLN